MLLSRYLNRTCHFELKALWSIPFLAWNNPGRMGIYWEESLSSIRMVICPGCYFLSQFMDLDLTSYFCSTSQWIKNSNAESCTKQMNKNRPWKIFERQPFSRIKKYGKLPFCHRLRNISFTSCIGGELSKRQFIHEVNITYSICSV